MAAENLRFAVADMVVEATEQVLKSQLGPEEHEKLIDKYLNKVVLNWVVVLQQEGTPRLFLP